MQLNTRHFGKIEIEDNKIVSFPMGLPGFDDKKEFILLSKTEEDIFSWLQCVEDPNVAFALVDVLKFMPDYDPLISMEDLKCIDILDQDEDIDKIISYNIVVIPEDIKEMRVNLKAPVIINTHALKGRQVLASNEDYEVRYKIFDKISSDI